MPSAPGAPEPSTSVPMMYTPNSPRSGMVPPDVTARRCAPGRPSMVPAFRSQMIRGRSSANSSEGYRPARRSRVASNADRGRDANGADRRTVANHSSTSMLPRAVAATVCWARMSSGLAGTKSRSIFPSSILSTVMAVCTRSARCLGNSTPCEISPTWCPARPTRWSPLATDGGDSTWTTRSTAPMSMPSSKDEVATTQRRRPDLRSSSMSARWSLETEPWWARASRGSAPAVLPACAIMWAGVAVEAGTETGLNAGAPGGNPGSVASASGESQPPPTAISCRSA